MPGYESVAHVQAVKSHGNIRTGSSLEKEVRSRRDKGRGKHTNKLSRRSFASGKLNRVGLPDTQRGRVASRRDAARTGSSFSFSHAIILPVCTRCSRLETPRGVWWAREKEKEEVRLVRHRRGWSGIPSSPRSLLYILLPAVNSTDLHKETNALLLFRRPHGSAIFAMRIR